MMEASIILQIENKVANIENNINWTQSTDYGGEGPKNDEEKHFEHWVYLAVKPLPRFTDFIAAESAHQHEEHIGERAAAESAHQH